MLKAKILCKIRFTAVIYRHSNKTAYLGNELLLKWQVLELIDTGYLYEHETVKTKFDTYTYYKSYLKPEPKPIVKKPVKKKKVKKKKSLKGIPTQQGYDCIRVNGKVIILDGKIKK